MEKTPFSRAVKQLVLRLLKACATHVRVKVKNSSQFGALETGTEKNVRATKSPVANT